jgi:hypothetical protein
MLCYPLKITEPIERPLVFNYITIIIGTGYGEICRYINMFKSDAVKHKKGSNNWDGGAMLLR